jgi:hypothetical protein
MTSLCPPCLIRTQHGRTELVTETLIDQQTNWGYDVTCVTRLSCIGTTSQQQCHWELKHGALWNMGQMMSHIQLLLVRIPAILYAVCMSPNLVLLS